MRDFLIEMGGCTVIDDGLAIELEANGADLNDPLWNAKGLISSHLIRKVSPSISLFSLFFFINIRTGSLDTNIKIWDIRRKNCIHTYKGHTRGVNVLRFTPDGKWVVSGGEDSSVKVAYSVDSMSAGAFANWIRSPFDRRKGLEFHNFRYVSGSVRVVLNATIMCVLLFTSGSV
ncbi:Katanin p80 WD40 repeat-containing subunit B1 [Carex littledalei]|uniref:Katanin p80 WD40 repeat-containing subunit B1 n=1 Tax=Carex littledalei TaxID=544730 RepID=A0A833RAE2_9POAL|nr:Katanin p80 WD40 repeat-containing subunit B1 [Carex littledalei]